MTKIRKITGITPQSDLNMRLTVIRDIDDATGMVVAEEYWKNEKRHRDGDLPAVIIRDAATGTLACEAYLKDGSLHRDYGQPAVIQRNSVTGKIVCEEYWTEGTQIQKADAETCIANPKLETMPSRRLAAHLGESSWLNQVTVWFTKHERNTLARPH